MSSAPTHRLFRAESVSRSLGFYIPATITARAVGLVRGVILARLISTHEFGLFQVTSLLVNVLNPLCALGLNEGVTRYVPMYETRGRLASYLRQVVPFISIIALVLSALVYFAAYPIGRLVFATLETAGAVSVTPATWTGLTRITAATTFGMIVYFLLLSVLKGLRMFRAISLLELLNNVMFTTLTIALALGGWRTAGVMMSCFGLSMLVLVPLFAWPLRRIIRDTVPPDGSASNDVTEISLPATDEGETIEDQVLASHRHTGTMAPGTVAAAGAASPLTQLLRFSAWAAVAAVIWQTLQYYPMWYLQKTHGPTLPAIFGSVRLVTQVVVIGAITIVAVVQTSVTKTWESQGHAAADQRLALAYKSTALAMLVGCVLFAAAAQPIMRLFPREYAIGAAIVPLCLMFFLISGHLSFLAVHFALIERMRHLFLPWAIGLASNIGLSPILVTTGMSATQAIVGAAWAGSLSMTAAMIAAIALLRCERRPIDAGTVVFWIAIYVLTLPVWAELILTTAILAAVLGTNLVFTAEEKRELSDYVERGWRQVMQIWHGNPRATGGGQS